MIGDKSFLLLPSVYPLCHGFSCGLWRSVLLSPEDTRQSPRQEPMGKTVGGQDEDPSNKEQRKVGTGVYFTHNIF